MNKPSTQQRREYQEWLELCERIRSANPLPINETEEQKRRRIEQLRGNFADFCKYYFSDYMDSAFGWFHLKAAKEITQNPNVRAILEWPREHAKSVFADVFIPLFLYARGELTGVVIASANGEKANGLLGDLQAQFTANDRFIHDYGNRAAFGDWQEGKFATTDGCGFWAFGRGQSPRGVRKAAKRPNYIVVDDIDDKGITKNLQRVKEAVDWVLEDLYGAGPIKGTRLIIAGNRIHKHSILAHLVGDTEPEQPKREGIIHIKVFALEDKKHGKAMNGTPAWKERYTAEEILAKMQVMGTRSALREYFHEHIEEGNVFKNDWIHWGPVPPIDHLDIEVYTDPSFKDTKNNDYKATIAIGRLKKGAPDKHGRSLKIFILKAWVRQASVKSMVSVMYDLHDIYGERARYWMEANFMQDLLLREFDTEAQTKGYHLPIRKDTRSKPDKDTRIENLSPLFERGHIIFNEAERSSPDMQTLVQQLAAFPTGHDDGPDALEGGVFYLNRSERESRFAPRTGRFAKNRERTM